MTLPGLLINRIIALLKAYTNFIAIVLLTVGLIFFVFKAGMFLLTLGVILTGFGYGIMQPIIYDKTASHVKPSEATFVLSLVMVMNYIAIITYPFILQGIESLFSTDSAYFPFILSTIMPVVSVFLPFSVIIRRPSIDGQDKRPLFRQGTYNFPRGRLPEKRTDYKRFGQLETSQQRPDFLQQ